jgi:RNA polymerase sigma-70 factor, ECF subfamily
VEPAAARSAAQSSTAQFRQLFEAEHAYVFHSLRRLGVPERDLADVTHDVFVIVYRKLSDYDAGRPVRPWLLAISARVASDYRRLARNRREHVEAAPESADPAPAADDRVAAGESRALVIAALQAVDEGRRSLLMMVDLDEVSVPEAANALGTPLSTAYSRLRLARAELAAAVHRLRARRGGP